MKGRPDLHTVKQGFKVVWWPSDAPLPEHVWYADHMAEQLSNAAHVPVDDRRTREVTYDDFVCIFPVTFGDILARLTTAWRLKGEHQLLFNGGRCRPTDQLHAWVEGGSDRLSLVACAKAQDAGQAEAAVPTPASGVPSQEPSYEERELHIIANMLSVVAALPEDSPQESEPVVVQEFLADGSVAFAPHELGECVETSPKSAPSDALAEALAGVASLVGVPVAVQQNEPEFSPLQEPAVQQLVEVLPPARESSPPKKVPTGTLVEPEGAEAAPAVVAHRRRKRRRVVEEGERQPSVAAEDEEQSSPPAGREQQALVEGGGSPVQDGEREPTSPNAALFYSTPAEYEELLVKVAAGSVDITLRCDEDCKQMVQVRDRLNQRFRRHKTNRTKPLVYEMAAKALIAKEIVRYRKGELKSATKKIRRSAADVGEAAQMQIHALDAVIPMLLRTRELAVEQQQHSMVIREKAAVVKAVRKDLASEGGSDDESGEGTEYNEDRESVEPEE